MASRGLFLFVSHVSEDRAAALQVVSELERRGLRCWIAPRDILAGKAFDDEIADAIEECRALLLIFSNRCNESEYIRREVTVAGNANKLIIPFRIENAEPKRGLSVRLANLHWIDAFVARESAIDEVLQTIRPPEGQNDRSRAAQSSTVAAATSGYAPAGESGVQIVSGLLVVQSLLRAGMVVFVLAMLSRSVTDEPESLFQFGLSAATLVIALGITRRRRWARVFGMIVCAIEGLNDALFVTMVVLTFATAGRTPKPEYLFILLGFSSALNFAVDTVVFLYLYRAYRPLPGPVAASL